MPATEADRINAAVGQVLRDPVILERLDRQGVQPKPMSNAEFRKLLEADYARMARVVKASGARID